MQFPIQWNSQFNAIPVQCNSKYNAIPIAVQFSLQCNSQCNARTNIMQFPIQCIFQCNIIPKLIAQCKCSICSKCTTTINTTLKGPVVSSLARFFHFMTHPNLYVMFFTSTSTLNYSAICLGMMLFFA